MTRVFAGHAYAQTLTQGQPLTFQHEMTRRMSPLQKVVLDGAALFAAAERPLYDLVFQQLETPIYYATAIGELDSVLKIFHAIAAQQLPVSPTAFQHSVHNAALGYFSIINKSHASHATVSSGYLSAEKAMMLAERRIRSGMNRCICIVSATECPGQDKLLAKSELFLLFAEELATSLRPTHELLGCDYFGEEPRDRELRTRGAPGVCQHRETTALSGWPPPFAWSEQKALTSRSVFALDGEGIVSSWRPL